MIFTSASVSAENFRMRAIGFDVRTFTAARLMTKYFRQGTLHDVLTLAVTFILIECVLRILASGGNMSTLTGIRSVVVNPSVSTFCEPHLVACTCIDL